MRNILVTTDFSKHSRHTLMYVLKFLQETQIPCKIHLLNTYVVQNTDPDVIIALNDEMKRKSIEGLEQEKSEALKLLTNPNIVIETYSQLGSLNNVILQFLKKTSIDLVAMGKNGGRHVETVSQLLKKQQCPLLVTYLNEA